MSVNLERFEGIARRAWRHSEAQPLRSSCEHAFDTRNIDPDIARVARRLFDDGHYPQATLEAFKYIDKQVKSLSDLPAFGTKLMQSAFNADNPVIRLTPMSNDTERNEQRGYQFLFAGAMLAIRDRRAHECGLADSPEQCLDHLVFASLLLRRLTEAGYTRR